MSFEQLHTLKKLFEEGFIDETEYASRKRQIVDNLTRTSLLNAAKENASNAESGSSVIITNSSPSEHQEEEEQRQEEEEEETNNNTESPSTARKKRKVTETIVKRSDEDQETTEEPEASSEPTDSNATYTWSELIEKALSVLGGSRTGHEITEFIEVNYPHILTNKTKTWKNSVFGCLSSNARKRWLKEQSVVNGKKRFVWRLNKGDQQSTSASPNADQLNSPFAAKTLSKMKRKYPSSLTDLSYRADTLQLPNKL